MCSPALSVVAATTLNAFYQHYGELSESLRNEVSSLATTRQLHLECLLFTFRLAHDLQGFPWSNPKRKHILGVVLDCMADYVDLLRIHPDLASDNGCGYYIIVFWKASIDG